MTSDLRGYRQMSSNEIKQRLPEIGKFYEKNLGFIRSQDFKANDCIYCSIDNLVWTLGDAILRSGFYGATKESCKSNMAGLCSIKQAVYSYKKSHLQSVVQRCLLREEDFHAIKLVYSYDHCKGNEYALFIDSDIN